MTNQDLFRFPFVDRGTETKMLRTALSDRNKIPVIFGAHGAGKTEFIKQFCKNEYPNDYIYVSFEEEQSGIGSIDQFMSVIQENVEQGFFDFIKKTLKVAVKVLGKQTVDIYGARLGIDLTSFAEFLDFGARYKVSDREVSASYMIREYLGYLHRDIIIIDNFHLCDRTAFILLSEILKELVSSTEDLALHFVLVVTETENNVIYRDLSEEVPIHKIRLNEFDQCNLFFRILRGMLDIDDKDRTLIEEIFTYCKGNPRKLKELIHVMEEKGAIYYTESSEKATLNRIMVRDILKERLEYPALCTFSTMEQCIISAITCFGTVLSESNLQALSMDLYKYISRLATGIENEYRQSLMNLYRMGIVSSEIENNIIFWSMDHDLVFIYYREEAISNPFISGIHGHIAEFIRQNCESLQTQGINNLLFESIYARHAHEGRVTNWEVSVYDVGMHFLSSGNYLLAAEQFKMLGDSSYAGFFDNKKILTIAECLYSACEYQDSEMFMEKFDINSEDVDGFRYWCLKSKLDKVLLRQRKAEASVARLLDVSNQESDYNKILALSTAERVFLNSPMKRKEAISYYQRILEYEDDKTVEQLVGRCLKTSIEYYRGEQAQEALEKAERIARKYDDCYDLAAIYTNRGFDFFWQGQIETAKENFIKARDILRDTCPAEISYPLHNLANCHMVEGDIQSAIETLNLALLWNRSEYVSTTAKAILLLCEAINSGDISRMKTEISKMETIANNPASDISIRIKINYILSRIHKTCNNGIQASAFKDKAFEIARAHDQSYLPYIWMPGYSEEIDKDMARRMHRDKYPKMYDYGIDPWLVTLSHE